MAPHNRDSDEIPVGEARSLLRAIKSSLSEAVAPLGASIEHLSRQFEDFRERLSKHETRISILEERDKWERDSQAVPVVKPPSKPRKYLADHLTPETVRYLALALLITAVALLAFAMGGKIDLTGLLPGGP